MKIYTVTKNKIEEHKVVRKTNSGWTCYANWSRNKVQTTHIKERTIGKAGYIDFSECYTAESKSEAVDVANKIIEALELTARDLYSSVMKYED